MIKILLNYVIDIAVKEDVFHKKVLYMMNYQNHAIFHLFHCKIILIKNKKLNQTHQKPCTRN